jgi:hypothetical protein
MASFSFTVTKVIKQNGNVYIRWSDGSESEFSSLAKAQEVRDSLSERKSILKDMAIARYLRVDPTAATPSLIEGHTITYTDEANSMVNVS